MRDELSDRRVALMRSQLDGTALKRREIVARVNPDFDNASFTDALGARGVEVAEELEGPALQVLDDQAAANASGIQPIDSLAELNGCRPAAWYA